MRFSEKKVLSQIEKEQIRSIWNKEYPVSISHPTLESFENYLTSLQNTVHYLIIENELICGWGLTFDREHERWFALIIDRNLQGKGLGKDLIHQMKLKENSLNGWVVIENDSPRLDGSPYPLPIDFYLKNGFQKTTIVLESAIFTTQKIIWKS